MTITEATTPFLNIWLLINRLFSREEYLKTTSPRNINVLEQIFANYVTHLATHKAWTCACMTAYTQTVDMTV
jgi:hypothetical protein